MRLQAQFVVVLFTALQGRSDCQVNAAAASSPADTAALISREIEELQNAPQRVPVGSPQHWRMLALHQQIYEFKDNDWPGLQAWASEDPRSG